MNGVNGKRLLILGANPETAELVKVAKEMGVVTIVTDYNPEAPAKEIADISYNIDATDVEALYVMANEEKVDGVLVGVADPLIVPYEKLCRRLGLPCYANKRSAAVFTNKRKLKDLCIKYDIKGVPEYHYPKDLRNMSYPVVVKPVDSNSGKGITICYQEEKLREAICCARQVSKTDAYLIEKYMKCRDVSIYYTIQDGYPVLSLITDRYTTKENNIGSQVCLGDIAPSGLKELFIEKEHSKYCRMLKDLNVQNGILYLSAFFEDGEFYVYDPGFRLQGGGFHLILKYATGIDQQRMLIEYAITGRFGERIVDIKNPLLYGGKAAAVIWFLLGEGKIEKIDGYDIIKKNPYVTHVIKRFSEGDIIEHDMLGTENQVFLRVFLQAENKSILSEVLGEFRKKVHVWGINGEDMLLPILGKEQIL